MSFPSRSATVVGTATCCSPSLSRIPRRASKAFRYFLLGAVTRQTGVMTRPPPSSQISESGSAEKSRPSDDVPAGGARTTRPAHHGSPGERDCHASGRTSQVLPQRRRVCRVSPGKKAGQRSLLLHEELPASRHVVTGRCVWSLSSFSSWD